MPFNKNEPLTLKPWTLFHDSTFRLSSQCACGFLDCWAAASETEFKLQKNTRETWKRLKTDFVQSNQKMHDLYATKYISQMVLQDAFWAV